MRDLNAYLPGTSHSGAGLLCHVGQEVHKGLSRCACSQSVVDNFVCYQTSNLLSSKSQFAKIMLNGLISLARSVCVFHSIVPDVSVHLELI